jgi:hypothetical protein
MRLRLLMSCRKQLRLESSRTNLKTGVTIMCLERLLLSIAAWCVSTATTLCLAAVLAEATYAATAIKIDAVANKYELEDFSFEASPETGNAGIRLEYAYPGSWLEGDDSDRGPAPRIAMVPGLIYDAASHAIVYDDGATRTTCATEVDRTVAFWKTVRMKPTGACKVSAHVIHHARNNRWSIDRFTTLDTYFEVRPR